MTLPLYTCIVHQFVIFAPICNKSSPTGISPPHFVLTKIALICKNNESHSANYFRRWFIGTCTLQVLPGKTFSLSYDLFQEKHLYIQ